MKNRIFQIEKFKGLKIFRYELFSSLIFIIYSLIYYSSKGYDYYKDNWGIDQYWIEEIAERILNGFNLVGHFSHGIGYPILVAPFIHIAANPLNIANFFIFTFFSGTIFRNFDIAIKNKRNKFVLIFFVVVALLFSPDMLFWTIGGSNTLTAVLILLSILWSVSSAVPQSLPIILGVLSGLVFSSRYIDYVLLFPLYFSSIYNYSNIYNKNLFKTLIKSFLISSIFIIFTLIVHQAILGDFFATPYDTKVADPSRLSNIDIGESISDQFQNRYFSWIVPNLYSTFIDYSSFASKMTGKGAYTALRNCPILILAPYSVINSLIFYFRLPKDALKKRLKITLLSVLSSLSIWIIFYASGWAYTAHDLKWYCLRYFMGWTTLFVFISLFGIILKPNFKSFVLSSFVYILLINYPSYYLDNQFKNIQEITAVEVYEKDNEKIRDNFNLPIPFDDGKKSLLYIQDDGIFLANDNFTNTILIGDCKLKNKNIDSIKKSSNSCNYLNTRKLYLPEYGMEFLDVQKSTTSYTVFYKVLNQGLLTNEIFVIRKSDDTKIEDQGDIKLILDSEDRYKVIDENNRISYVKRNKKYYQENSSNLYYPHWSLISAESINSSNQIVTSNPKDKIYCIWELDKKWNYKKDKLCDSFDNNAMLNKHEEEFKVDIDNDGLINQSIYKKDQNKLKFKAEDKKSNIVFKVDPINMEKNKIRLKFEDKLQIKKNLELNIKLTKTGDVINKTFPELVSISCANKSNQCKAYKIGRFNNLWRIWIKAEDNLQSIDINTEKISKSVPSFWPIQYITIRNK